LQILINLNDLIDCSRKDTRGSPLYSSQQTNLRFVMELQARWFNVDDDTLFQALLALSSGAGSFINLFPCLTPLLD
jgi:hypothetical protein